MSDNYGTPQQVSRVLPAKDRQFTNVVFQKGKPPLDAELNLQDDIKAEQQRVLIQSQTPSGWVSDAVGSLRDYVTAKNWSNHFYLGKGTQSDPPAGFSDVQYAVVNGWMVPVAGTRLDGAANQIRLNPAPETNSRVDFVFLEVWRAAVAPNPSQTNKPSASTVFRYGNVEYGGPNPVDDFEDPAIGFETTRRVQVQYRIRVFGQGSGGGSGVALDVYPDGLGDPNIHGQGASSSPVAGFAFQNMRSELGDAGLWRAGNGNPTNGLGTVDGYVYAIPICAVFRRNSNTFVAVSGAGNPNQNGAYDRNRSAANLTDPRDGARVFTAPTLNQVLSRGGTGTFAVSGLSGSPLSDPVFVSELASGPKFLVLKSGGRKEIVEITAVDLNSSPGTVTISSRGRAGTSSYEWEAGTELELFTVRPDGLFADEIAARDILDLRRSITFGEWDYHRMLTHNLDLLFRNRLFSTYKQNGTGGFTEGPVLTEVSYLWSQGNDSNRPNHTGLVDGPDGVRTVFSDSAIAETGITTLLDPSAPSTAGLVPALNAGVNWGLDPGFTPSGWINNTDGEWSNGSMIFLNIGGPTGTTGARGSFADNGPEEGSVRFLMPRENPDNSPFKINFIAEPITQPKSSEDTGPDRPGPLFPRMETGFEKPFIALGGVLRPDLRSTSLSTDTMFTSPSGPYPEIDFGIDFDATSDDLLLSGTRTLRDMLTDGGKDPSGESSEAYLILFGDANNPVNNGVFKIVGAGTAAGGTLRPASSPTGLVLKAVTVGFSSFVPAVLPTPPETMTGEIRSQYSTSNDADLIGVPSAVVAFTDIQNVFGGESNPWNATNTGGNALGAQVSSKAVLTTGVQYGPSRGGFIRTPDTISRAALRVTSGDLLRRPVSEIDATFAPATGFPQGETEFEVNDLRTWSRVSRDYRSDIYAENAREAELFVDTKTRTLVFRPFQKKDITLHTMSGLGSGSLIGDPLYPNTSNPKDAATVFVSPSTADVQNAIPLPNEILPAFGRQDIPFHVYQGPGDNFLGGINHLFCDTLGDTDSVFRVIGGPPVPAGGVQPMLFQTGDVTGVAYGGRSEITIPQHPAYQARLIAVRKERSGGKSLRGIQLPPYLGIARLYGVYERQDYINNAVPVDPSSSVPTPGAFLPDRVTPKANFPTNLLREDARQNTLFILEDGAEDATGSKGDHTYIVTSESLDITRIPGFGGPNATDFSDFDYVVEAVVFGFARGFISENNYVLTRRLDGQGNPVNPSQEFEVESVIPAPAPNGVPLYTLYDRVAYQGDPFMTRDGETRQSADAPVRYGQILRQDSYELNFPIQQYDENGDMLVETPNLRPLEILASLDFWTTLGTGGLSGQVFEDTITDVGFLQGDRIAELPSDPRMETASKLFTSPSEHVLNASQTWNVVDATGLDEGGGVGDVVLTFQYRGETRTVTVTNVTATPGSESVVASQIVQGLNTARLTFPWVSGAWEGGTSFRIVSNIPGSLGNEIRVSISLAGGSPSVTRAFLNLSGRPAFASPRGETPDVTVEYSGILSGNLVGGVSVGTSSEPANPSSDYNGMIAQLPLGILVQDSDFASESVSGRSLAIVPSIQDPRAGMPVPSHGIGTSGDWIMMSDGSIKQYTAFDEEEAPSGTKRFRVLRGASATALESGAPIRWSFGTGLDATSNSGVLLGKALLVRNTTEEAFVAGASGRTRSFGDEIQMVILTSATFGGENFDAEISASGYGDGFAAADRYRLEGKPMERVRGQVPEVGDLVPYRERDGIRIDSDCP